MGIEEQDKQAQEEATKARKEFKQKWSKRANYFLVISTLLIVVVWYSRYQA